MEGRGERFNKMATTKDIESLKANWKNDPCWDIEHTEGFEEHKQELKDFRIVTENVWHSQRFARLSEKARRLGIGDNFELLRHIEAMENRIKNLETIISILDAKP